MWKAGHSKNFLEPHCGWGVIIHPQQISFSLPRKGKRPADTFLKKQCASAEGHPLVLCSGIWYLATDLLLCISWLDHPEPSCTKGTEELKSVLPGNRCQLRSLEKGRKRRNFSLELLTQVRCWDGPSLSKSLLFFCFPSSYFLEVFLCVCRQKHGGKSWAELTWITGGCGKAALPLAREMSCSHQAVKWQTWKLHLQFSSRDQKLLLAFSFSRRSLHSLLSPQFFSLLPVTLYRGAGGRNDRERLLSLSPTLSIQYTRPFCFGLFQKQDPVEPSVPAAQFGHSWQQAAGSGLSFQRLRTGACQTCFAWATTESLLLYFSLV